MYGGRKKKPAITILERKDITDYVRSFVLHMRNTQGRVFNMRHSGEVGYIKQLMNDPRNTTYKSMRDWKDGDYFWHQQEIDYMPSNLRKGFIFYFICNGCRRRVKYLYEYSMLKSPLCRMCCRLSYEQPGRKARALSKLFRKPYFSTEDKYVLIKRAGLTKDEVLALTN